MSNEDQYLEILRRLDPELYILRESLLQTGVDPMILPRIVRQIKNLEGGTGYGKIQIFMQNKVVTQIKAEESDEINRLAVIAETNR